LGISAGGTTYPILLSCDYSKGKLFILTIPSDPADLYALPPTALSVIRAQLGSEEPVRIDNAPTQVSLFRYDNNTFIVQNFLPTAAAVTVSIQGTVAAIRDLLTGNALAPAPITGRRLGEPGGRVPAAPQRTLFTFTAPPHSYIAFTTE